MPAPLISREEIFQRLLECFRNLGYEGTTMSILSRETGLSKASLYHYFPGGKEQMVNDVITNLRNQGQECFQQVSNRANPLKKRQQLFFETVRKVYNEGASSCLIAALVHSNDLAKFQATLDSWLNDWIQVISGLLEEQGVSQKACAEYAEEALCQIQGALILSKAKNDTQIFIRALERLEDKTNINLN